MPQSPVDQEAFLAWLEHPVTRWARDQFRVRALAIADQQRDHLFNSSPSQTAVEWADSQAKASNLLGLCEGLMNFADVTYDAIREETDEEIKELEKKGE